MPAYELTVQQDFGAYKRGDAIVDESAIKAVLGGENAFRVVKVAVGTHAVAAAAPDAPKAVEAETAKPPKAADAPKA